MLAGLVIVAGSVLLGARLLATDDTVAVWAVRADLGSGTVIEAADLERQDVRFPSRTLAERYVSADSSLPEGSVALRPLGAGELLPRAALAESGREPLAEVPLSVAAESVPATLRPGAVVDVWVTPQAAGGEQADAERVLEAVTVVALPQSGGALGPASTRQVVVGVPGEDEAALATALGRLSRGAAVIVKRD